MLHTEVKLFLKQANEEKLTPIEKDVFQYYFACTQNESGEWFCPDAEVAEAIGRSRNGVCDARKSLKRRKWIEEREQFNISIKKTFAVGNQTENKKSVSFQTQNDISVGNQTQKQDSQSEIRLDEKISVGNQTQPVSFQTEEMQSSVGNQTGTEIDFKGIYLRETKGIEVENKEEKEREEKSPFPPFPEIPVSEIFDSDNEPEEPIPEEYSPTKAIALWREFYPNRLLDGQQLDDFAEALPDEGLNEKVWRENVKDWRLAKWGATNFPGMIERYEKKLKAWEKEQLEKTEKPEGGNKNGTNQANNQTTGQRNNSNAVKNRQLINSLRRRGGGE